MGSAVAANSQTIGKTDMHKMAANRPPAPVQADSQFVLSDYVLDHVITQASVTIRAGLLKYPG
jgi:hypothetical protein